MIGGSSNNQAVAEKEAKVLHKLLSTEGIVTREELYADVWGTQYKSPDALNRVIKELRRKLSDNPYTPLYIETIRGDGGGYKFLKQVSISTEASKEPVTENSTNSHFLTYYSNVIYLFSLVFILVVAYVYSSFSGWGKATTRTSFELEKLNLPKLKTAAALSSPDSKYVAYIFLGDTLRQEVKLTIVANEEDGRTIYSERAVGRAVFSPDSKKLAYIQKNDNGCWMKVIELATQKVTKQYDCIRSTNLVWDLEGEGILFSDVVRTNTLSHNLHHWDLKTNRTKQLTNINEGGYGYFSLAMNEPDNTIIALRTSDYQNNILEKIAIDGSSVEQLGTLNEPPSSIAVAKNKLIYIHSKRYLISRDLTSGNEEVLLDSLLHPIDFVNNIDQDSLTFVSGKSYSSNIVNLTTNELSTLGGNETSPFWIKGKLYFVSNANGNQQIWAAKKAGDEPVLTHVEDSKIKSFDIRHENGSLEALVYYNNGKIKYFVNGVYTKTCFKNMTHGHKPRYPVFGKSDDYLYYIGNEEGLSNLYRAKCGSGNSFKMTTNGAHWVKIDEKGNVYTVDYLRSGIFLVDDKGIEKFVAPISDTHISPKTAQIMNGKLYYVKPYVNRELGVIDLTTGEYKMITHAPSFGLAVNEKEEIFSVKRTYLPKDIYRLNFK